MTALTHHQVITLTRAAVMLPTFAAVLSDHEQATIAEVCGRFATDHRTAFVTDAEWPVIIESVEAMERALRSEQRTEDAVAGAAAGVRAGSPQPAAIKDLN